MSKRKRISSLLRGAGFPRHPAPAYYYEFCDTVLFACWFLQLRIHFFCVLSRSAYKQRGGKLPTMVLSETRGPVPQTPFLRVVLGSLWSAAACRRFRDPSPTAQLSSRAEARVVCGPEWKDRGTINTLALNYRFSNVAGRVSLLSPTPTLPHPHPALPVYRRSAAPLLSRCTTYPRAIPQSCSA